MPGVYSYTDVIFFLLAVWFLYGGIPNLVKNFTREDEEKELRKIIKMPDEDQDHEDAEWFVILDEKFIQFKLDFRPLFIFFRVAFIIYFSIQVVGFIMKFAGI